MCVAFSLFISNSHVLVLFIHTIRTYFLRESQAREALGLRAPWEWMAAPRRPPNPLLAPLLKLDPRSNQRQLGVVGGN